MKISYNWLRTYLPVDLTPERMGEILTQTGLEVEGIARAEAVPGGLKGLVIGEVVLVDMPDHCLLEEGSVDLALAGTVALSGLDTYHDPVTIKQMAYAKPDLPPRSIDRRPG